eukprot:scaffold69_cov248-Pinguiococcus_pyrenoidosus.AAC.21
MVQLVGVLLDEAQSVNLTSAKLLLADVEDEEQPVILIKQKSGALSSAQSPMLIVLVVLVRGLVHALVHALVRALVRSLVRGCKTNDPSDKSALLHMKRLTNTQHAYLPALQAQRCGTAARRCC